MGESGAFVVKGGKVIRKPRVGVEQAAGKSGDAFQRAVVAPHRGGMSGPQHLPETIALISCASRLELIRVVTCRLNAQKVHKWGET
jgi:hypothetical protein